MAVGKPNVGFETEERAPGRVVFKKLTSETTEDGWVKGVNVVRRRRETHLSISEVKYNVFPLVTDVRILKAEEKGEPVKEVIVRFPRCKWRSPQVTNGA